MFWSAVIWAGEVSVRSTCPKVWAPVKVLAMAKSKEMAGVVPPEETIGLVPVTAVTPVELVK